MIEQNFMKKATMGVVATFFAIVMQASCSSPPPNNPPPSSSNDGWKWNIPHGVAQPIIPEDNPMSKEKVELGRYLFYDTKFSLNQTFSCASCHDPARAFTEPLPVSIGSTGEHHPRNAMNLTNAAYNTSMNWANLAVRSLEVQAMTPIFGTHPVELGMSGKEELLEQRLKADPLYQKLFPKAFPDRKEDLFNILSATQAIAAFERTFISFNSPYDKYINGDDSAMSESAKRGMDLFFSERCECFHCHGGFNFTQSSGHEGQAFIETPFHNNGLYNIGGTGDYPSDNIGIYEFTGRKEDMGKFKAPTLRNVEVTAPYMHDGSIATLEEVIDHYARGGRKIDSGPYAGDGALNPYKSPFVKGFVLTKQEREDLLNFLKSLTDKEFLTNPALSDPFKKPSP